MNTCRGIGALWACASDGASGETVCVHAREVNRQNEAAITLVTACMKGSFRGSEYPTQAKKAFPPEKADRAEPISDWLGCGVVCPEKLRGAMIAAKAMQVLVNFIWVYGTTVTARTVHISPGHCR